MPAHYMFACPSTAKQHCILQFLAHIESDEYTLSVFPDEHILREKQRQDIALSVEQLVGRG